MLLQLIRIHVTWVCCYLACLSGVPHHRNCLAMLNHDSWGGAEQFPIGFTWFAFWLIQLNFEVTFWACLYRNSGSDHSWYPRRWWTISNQFHLVHLRADLAQVWGVAIWACLLRVSHHRICLAMLIPGVVLNNFQCFIWFAFSWSGSLFVRKSGGGTPPLLMFGIYIYIHMHWNTWI